MLFFLGVRVGPASGTVHRYPCARLEAAGGIGRAHNHRLIQRQSHGGSMALCAGLLTDDRSGLTNIGQQLIGGIGNYQHITGVKLLRHGLQAAAHAQTAAGLLGTNAHGIDQGAAHLMDPDHIGGTGHTHRHAGSDHDQISLLDQTGLHSGLDGKLHQFIRAAGIGHGQGFHTPVQCHLPLHLRIQQQRHHRGAGPEAADHLSGHASLADGEDGIGANVHGRGAGGVGRGGRDGKTVLAHHLHGPHRRVHIGLSLAGNGIHRPHSLYGILARSRLAGEHDGRGSIINGVGHVGDLRPGGTGIFNHGVQHLGGGNDRLAAGHTFGNHILLQNGDLGEVDFHAQIAAGHHDAVGYRQNLRQIGNTLLILHLGNNPDGGTLPIQQAADFPHIRRRADKAGGNIIKALFDTEENIIPVSLAHIRHVQPHAGHVDTLVVLHDAVIFHAAANFCGGGLQHSQTDQAVIEQNGVSFLHVSGQIRIGNGAAVYISGNILRGQCKLRAGHQFHRAILKGFEPDLGPLGIQHGRHGPMQFLPQGLQDIQPGLVLFMAAVGEIKPGHIHSGQDHIPQHTLPVCGGAQCADNLRLSHIHRSISAFLK